MATRNIVPRANDEGNIGTALKNWLKGWFKDLTVAGAISGALNGSVGGTTPAAGSFTTITGGGNYTNPSQPCFDVYLSTSQLNIAKDAAVIIAFDTERFDIGSNFNTTTNRFIAPVTGKYLFTYSLYVYGIPGDNIAIIPSLVTSNRPYENNMDITSSGDRSANYSVITEMDTNDVCYVRIYYTGGTGGVIDVGTQSSFSGTLLN